MNIVMGSLCVSITWKVSTTFEREIVWWFKEIPAQYDGWLVSWVCLAGVKTVYCVRAIISSQAHS